MDISKIKSRLTQLQSTTSTKDNFWKPQPGKTQIRIVPYKFNKENPFVEAFFHYQLITEKNSMLQEEFLEVFLKEKQDQAKKKYLQQG